MLSHIWAYTTLCRLSCRHVRAASALILLFLVGASGKSSADSVLVGKGNKAVTAVQSESTTAYELIVVFRESLSEEARWNIFSTAGVREKSYCARYRGSLVQIMEGRTRDVVESSLKQNQRISFIANNDPAEMHALPPTDPHYPSQWGIQRIKADLAWGAGYTGAGRIIVAVLDTGVALGHDEFAGRLNILPGSNLVETVFGCPAGNPNIPEDDNGHGSLVASIIGANANNATCIAGMDWQCMILPVKIGDCNKGSTSQKIADGIAYAVSNGARVINLSCGLALGRYNLYVDLAVRDAVKNGCVFVTSTGNDNASVVSFPAGLAISDIVLSVGASDKFDNRLVGSNYGTSIGYVSVVAPGEDISGAGIGAADTCVLGKWGTSFSAAYVSGLAALMMAVNNGMSATNYYEAIKLNAGEGQELPVPNAETGWGRINALQSFKPLPPIRLGVGSRNGNLLLRWDWPWARLYPLASFNVYRSASSGGPYTPLATGIPAGGPLEYEDTTAPCGSGYFYKLTSVDVNGYEGRFSGPVGGNTAGSVNSIHVSCNCSAVISGRIVDVVAHLTDDGGRGMGGVPVEFSTANGTLEIKVTSGKIVSDLTDEAGYITARFYTVGLLGPQDITIRSDCAEDAQVSVVVVNAVTVHFEDIVYQSSYPWCVPLYDQLAVPTGGRIPIASCLVGAYGSTEYPLCGEDIDYTLMAVPSGYAFDGGVPPPTTTDVRGMAEGKFFHPGEAYGTYSLRMSHSLGASKDVDIRAVAEMPQFRNDSQHSGWKSFERLKPPLRHLWQYRPYDLEPDAYPLYGSPIVATNAWEMTGGYPGRDVDVAIQVMGFRESFGGYSVVSMDESGSGIINAFDWYQYGQWNGGDQYSSPSVVPSMAGPYLSCALGVPSSPLPCHGTCDRQYGVQGTACGGESYIFWSGIYSSNEYWLGAVPEGGHGSPLAFVPHEIPAFRTGFPWFGTGSSDGAFLCVQYGQLLLSVTGDEYSSYAHDYSHYPEGYGWVTPGQFAFSITPRVVDSTPSIGNMGYAFVGDDEGWVRAYDLVALFRAGYQDYMSSGSSPDRVQGFRWVAGGRHSSGRWRA